MQGRCLLDALKGGQSYCHWRERMDKKPLGCHRAWQGWTVGKAKGLRALVVCVKIKGVSVSLACTWMCIYLSVLPWEQASNDTSKKSRLKHFFPNPQNPTTKQKCSHSRGSEWVLSIGQKACQSSQGVRRVVKTQIRAQWIFGIPHSRAHTHTLWKNAWLINLGEKKTQITLNWCSVCVNDKRFHKKKELDQPKNATDVNACSHGYWIGYNGGVHEEESLIQAEVHFTVVLALRGWDWEPFHSQRHLALGQKCLWSRARLNAMT